MRDLPLSKIKKKPASYFRNIGVVKKGRRRKSTIEYIIRKTYEALPKGLKEYIEDPEQAIKSITNMISVSDMGANIRPYTALKQAAMYQKRKSGDNTRQFLWNRFRHEEGSLYAKFNSYMYRQGLSARNYWFENVAMERNKNYINAYCELPKRTEGVQYNMLEMEYDFSGEEFNAYLT